MGAANTVHNNFWWSGNANERFWIEQLQTDQYGDRLIAPDTSAYRPMHGVEVGDVVFHWYSERHPRVRSGKSGIYAASRVIGRLVPSQQQWEGKDCDEIQLGPRNTLQRPILLEDLKAREAELRVNRDSLKARLRMQPAFSPWQFPKTGLKPMTRYLTKLTAADLEVITADHPHIAMTLAVI